MSVADAFPHTWNGVSKTARPTSGCIQNMLLGNMELRSKVCNTLTHYIAHLPVLIQAGGEYANHINVQTQAHACFLVGPHFRGQTKVYGA